MNNNIDQLKAITPLLRCPLCQSEFAMDANRLLCAQGHMFDRARHGYVNLLPRPTRTKYDKSLFASRRIVWQNGLWNPLLDLLTRLIEETADSGIEQPLLLDAGCGEGSLLSGVRHRLYRMGMKANAVGLDSAKDGVRMAAAADPGLAWCVADLARAPIGDGVIDVALNVLSPANYSEFFRMLKPGGTVVKVVPNRDYLHELRRALNPEGLNRQEDASGSEERTIQLFRARTADARSYRLRYSHELDMATARHLARMTPLGWQAGQAGEETFLGRLEPAITVDLTVLVGRRPI